MPKPGVVVGRIIQVGPPGTSQALAAGSGVQHTPVEIEGGVTCYLDGNDPRAPVWGDVLRELSLGSEPVYLKTDANTGIVRQVFIPDEQYVTRLAPLSGNLGYEVEFSNSHARHFLRPTDPDFTSNLAALRNAHAQGTPVLATETPDTLEILDVRPPTLPFAPAPALAPIAGLAAGAPAAFSAHSCPGMTPITTAQAGTLFGLVSALACPTVAPAAPCIPYAYPNDGCWGRAHEMARIMAAAGFTPCKIWSFGSLNPGTRYSPTCSVSWSWHVAPCVRVSTTVGTQVPIIDPSMFTQPVDDATWLSARNDPAVTSVMTDWNVFHWNSITGAVIFDPSP